MERKQTDPPSRAVLGEKQMPTRSRLSGVWEERGAEVKAGPCSHDRNRTCAQTPSCHTDSGSHALEQQTRPSTRMDRGLLRGDYEGRSR